MARRVILLVVIGILVIVGASALWWVYQRHTANQTREDVSKAFVGGHATVAEVRKLYHCGNAQDQALCRRMLLSMQVKEKVGAWVASGVDEALKAGEADPVNIKLTPIEGLVFGCRSCVWGEDAGTGVMESPVWIRFVLANFSTQRIQVERTDFLVRTSDNGKWSFGGLGAEPGAPCELAPNEALDSAVWIGTMYEPRAFEFNNGTVIARTIPPQAKHITDFKRDTGGSPLDEALVAYPVRTAFSQQKLTGEKAAELKPQPPAPKEEPKEAKTEEPEKKPVKAPAPAPKPAKKKKTPPKTEQP